MPPLTAGRGRDGARGRARRALGGRVRAHRAEPARGRHDRAGAPRAPARRLARRAEGAAPDSRAPDPRGPRPARAVRREGRQPAGLRARRRPARACSRTSPNRCGASSTSRSRRPSIERIRPLLAGFDRLDAPRVSPASSRRAALLVMEEVARRQRDRGAAARRPAARRRASCSRATTSRSSARASSTPTRTRATCAGPTAQVWFLDFGMVGELDPDVRLLLLLLVMAFWRDDAPFLAETLLMLSGPEAPAGLDLGGARAGSPGAPRPCTARIAGRDRARPRS